MIDINDADVAELVDARDLKCPAATDQIDVSCKTVAASPIETDGTNPDLQNKWYAPSVRTEALLGYTYFIQAGASIKIGSATNFKQRLKTFQTAHAKPLKVLAVVPATVAEEYAVHQLFAKLRERGEWFRADRELLNFIEQVKADAEAAERTARQRQKPPPPTNFDLAKRQLYRMRAGRKADDPIMYCCNNMIEMMDNYEKSKCEVQKGHLKKSMERQSRWLKELKAAAAA